MEKYTHNQERFPNIIQEPVIKEVNDANYKVYKFIFNGLSDLYTYLKSNPEINRHIFGSDIELSSLKGSEEFAGIPYDAAVAQLIQYEDPKYKEFLTISTKSSVKNLKLGAIFKPTNSVAGGIVRPQALATGDPHIYRTTKIYRTDKVVNINTIADYPWTTSKSQVYNKAVILTNIIHAYEEQGIKVNANVFSLSEHEREILDIVLKIKKNGRSTNYQALYRSLCNVEFLRRIIFRVEETSDVRTDWAEGYGSPCKEKFIRSYLNMDKNDLYLGTPGELGIRGKNIASDFERTVEKLELDDVIDVEKAKALIKKSVKKVGGKNE